MFIQTPQAFIFKIILKAHKKRGNINAKDDTILTEKIGIKTKLIKGCKKNIKIIRPGYGLSPIYFKKILGRRVTNNLKRGDRLLLKNIKI